MTTQWDGNSKTLRVIRSRVCFDPTNLDHLEEVQYFRQNGKWRAGCPFELEWPWAEIPSSINDRIAAHYISTMLK